ncbi:hypothetical protein [Corticicoccus populi]|uniref:Uncharacterized protein n=1 Tax=Corticicoccus populi TaxID=1812821 RepID=A0ABW5WW61_9STAP
MKIIGFLKYVLPEYASDFESGKIFMQNLFYYKDEGVPDTLIKDLDEGVACHEKDPNNYIVLFQIEGESEIHQLKELKSLRHSKWKSDIENIKIHCFTIITSEDVESTEDGLYKFKTSYLDSLPTYSEKRIIYITLDPNHFVNTIKNQLLEKEYISYRMGPVEYFDTKHPLFDNFNDIDNVLDTVFYKPNLYTSQREYRIAIYGYMKQSIPYNNYSDIWTKIDNLHNIRIKSH